MPSTVSQTKPLFEALDAFLSELNPVKTAAAPKGRTKAATEGVGKTTHPSEGIDDNTKDAPEGARAKENISDVEKAVQGDSITNETPIKANEDDVMPNIGVDQSATGEDASIETSSVKGDKDDPGTSHPADADKVGEKYAAMSVPQLLKVAEAKANNVLAHIAHGHFGAPAQAAAKTAPAQAKKAAAPAAQAAPAQAGYDAAAAAAQYEKSAAAFIETAMRDADLDADLVGSYLTTYHQKRAEAAKRAMDDAGGEGEDHKPEGGMGGMGGDPAAAGGPPPDMAGGAPPMGAPPMGAGGPPPDMGGGAPPAGGADPMAALSAAGNDQPAAPGGEDKAKALSDLGNVLAELGFTPDDLMQLAQQSGQAPAEGAKLASALTAYKRSGKFRICEPKTAQEKRSRDMIRDYVMEITGLKS